MIVDYFSYVLGIDICWKDYFYRTQYWCDCWLKRFKCSECKECSDKSNGLNEGTCEWTERQNLEIDKGINNLNNKTISNLKRIEVFCSVCKKDISDNDDASGEGNLESFRWFCKECHNLKKYEDYYKESGKSLGEYFKDLAELEIEKEKWNQ